jgi:hypothetical protein
MAMYSPHPSHQNHSFGTLFGSFPAPKGSMHALGVPVMCPKVLSWHYPEVMVRPQGLPEAPCMPLECQ